MTRGCQGIRRGVMCSLLGWLALAAAGAAAPVSDAESRELASLPGAPPDHILDADGLFQRHPERRRAVAERLQQLEADHGLPVYVAIYAGLLDSNLPRRTRLLYQKWIGSEREGVIITFNTDSKEHEVLTLGAGGEIPDDRGAVARLPDYQMIPILAELKVRLKDIEDHLEFVDRGTAILAERLDAVLRIEPPPVADRSALTFAAVTLAVGVLLTVLGVYGSRRLHLAERKARAQFFFPEVTMDLRLGAPFSGGRHSVVKFSAPRDRLDGETG